MSDSCNHIILWYIMSFSVDIHLWGVITPVTHFWPILHVITIYPPGTFESMFLLPRWEKLDMLVPWRYFTFNSESDLFGHQSSSAPKRGKSGAYSMGIFVVPHLQILVGSCCASFLNCFGASWLIPQEAKIWQTSWSPQASQKMKNWVHDTSKLKMAPPRVPPFW